jgi:hypothetical protein
MSKHLTFILLPLSFVSGVFVTALSPNPTRTLSLPPNSILICGIAGHPCVTYAVSYHDPTHAYGNGSGEGVTDYEKKIISIASSKDRFENVRSLEHEVYHAVLHERGIRDDETWDIHSWIYLSEGPFAMVLHDNPEFVHYVIAGYRSPEP